MALVQELKEKFEEFKGELSSLSSQGDIAKLKSDYIGKKGVISNILKSLKDLDADERKSVGQEANKTKEGIEDLVSVKLSEIEAAALSKKLEKEWIDITERDSMLDKGLQAAGPHPLRVVQKQLEDVFTTMGFDVLDGPHIETQYYNFEALNIPEDHPARDMQDTFWFKDGKHLLRTHTSPIQIRGMETHKPPFKFVGPGKVFRCERTDASHEFSFNQLEGLMVDRGVTVGHLIYFAKAFFTEVLGREVNLRTRPSYFPFVEPGLEIDVNCGVCGGKGCSVCKQSGWVEMLGSGMVHPNVLRMGGIDPKEYSGFAFGLGVDRLLMMKYGIDDIRHLQSGDLRFVSQFKSF